MPIMLKRFYLCDYPIFGRGQRCLERIQEKRRDKTGYFNHLLQLIVESLPL